MSDDITLVDKLQASALRWMVESHPFWALASHYLKPEWFSGTRRVLFQIVRLEHRRHAALVEQDVQFLYDQGKIKVEALFGCFDELAEIWSSPVMDEEKVWAAIGRTIKQPLRSILVDEMITAVGGRKPLDSFIARISEVERIGEMRTTNYVNLSADGDALLKILQLRKSMIRRGIGNPDLDKLMKGGPPTGTLTIFSGQTGIGKSMLLGQTVSHNALMGHEGAVISLELGHDDQASRIISPLIGMTIDEVIERPEEAVDKLTALKLPPIHVIYMDEGVSVEEIRNELYDNYSRTVDVVAIDYMDLVGGGTAMGKADGDYKAGKLVAKEMRKWAKHDAIQLYTASQPQRQSKKSKTDGPLGTEDMADSQHKARIADQMITVNVETREDGFEYVYAYTAKFRTGHPHKRTPSFRKDNWGSYGCVLPNPNFVNIPLDEKGLPVIPGADPSVLLRKSQPVDAYLINQDYDFEDA